MCGVQLGGRKGDVAVAALQQVLCHGIACVLLREARAVHAWGSRHLHQVHAGHAAGGNHLACVFGAIKACHQQACRAVGQVGAQQLLFFLRVVVGHANQGLVAQGKSTRCTASSTSTNKALDSNGTSTGTCTLRCDARARAAGSGT